LIKDFLQSLESSFPIGCPRVVFPPLQIHAVHSADFGYLSPQLVNTLFEGSLHRDRLAAGSLPTRQLPEIVGPTRFLYRIRCDKALYQWQILSFKPGFDWVTVVPQASVPFPSMGIRHTLVVRGDSRETYLAAGLVG
jgi:hypothetical protein